MATSTTLYTKNGNTVEAIAPSTSAEQVSIFDDKGNASNVNAEIIALREKISSAVDAGIHFKGTVTKTVPLPTVAYKAGWQYAVGEASTYAGQTCEPGDYIICVKDYASGSASAAKDWVVLQTNIVGAVTGPASAVTNHVATFNGTSGKQIKDSGFTIGKSVPANAVFTDTTYNPATTEADGLMSAGDKTKLNGIETGADKTGTDNVTAAGAFMKATDTADSVKDGTTKVVMTAAERTKLSSVATGAEVNQNAYKSIKVGTSTMSATTKTDTFEIAAGNGITLTPGTKKVTVAETYVDSCVVTSLDNVPANLRNGGLIILKS